MSQLTKINSEHLDRLDHLRVFACIWILLLHMGNFYGHVISNNNVILSPIQIIFREGHLATSAFFVLGAFLLTVLSRGGERPIIYHKFILNRLLRIMPVFIFCSFIIFSIEPYAGISSLITQILGFRTYGHWYVLFSLAYYLITPFLLSMLHNRGKIYIGYFLVLSIIGKIAAYYMFYSTTRTYDFYWTTYIDVFWTFDLWLLGMLFGKLYVENKFKLLNNQWIANILFIITSMIYILYIFFDINFKNSLYMVTFFQIQGVLLGLLIVSYMYSSILKNKYINSVMSSFSKLTFSIYLIHMFFMKIPILLPHNNTYNIYINTFLILLPISSVFAYCAYKCIEEPCLAMKVKYFKD